MGWMGDEAMAGANEAERAARHIDAPWDEGHGCEECAWAMAEGWLPKGRMLCLEELAQEVRRGRVVGYCGDVLEVGAEPGEDAAMCDFFQPRAVV